MAVYDYRIAAGHDVALVSLTNIETIIPSGDKRFYPPAAYSTYDPGLFRIRADGRLYIAGFSASSWVFRIMTRKQVAYLSTTYCNSGYSGNVTIYTRVGTESYARYNAVMILPKPVETTRNFVIFVDYSVRFVRMVAL